MRLKEHLRKAVLFTVIGLAGLIGSTGSTYGAGKAPVYAAEETKEAASDAAAAKTSEDASGLYPVEVQTDSNTKYGYIDGTGQMILQPVYDDAVAFSEGFAVVFYVNKFQLINEMGRVVYESVNEIGDVHNGLASFVDLKSSKQGYINTKGKVVIKAQYNYAGNFHTDGTAIVSKAGKFYQIDKKGKILRTYKLSKNFNYYGITEDGDIIYRNTKTFHAGLMDLDGKVILKAVYGDITYLGNGLFGVKKALPDMEAYLINIKPAAIFDKNGKKLTSYQYYDLSEFSGEYASATDDKYTFFIDKSGKEVTSLPKVEGRGTMKLMGNLIQADIDNEISYLKLDGTPVWKNEDTVKLPSGITVNTVTVRPNKYVVVHYPQLEGLSDTSVQSKLNAKLETMFTKDRMKLTVKDELSVDDTFTVKQIKDLLIIYKSGYDYPIGAAHGMPFRINYFVNVNTGDFYQLKDLFKSGSNYTTVLNKLINKQIKKNSENNYYFDSKVSISKNQYFYLSEDKLTIYFASGDIAAYAAGFPEFNIAWKDVSSIINKDGAFWKAFH